MSTQRLDVTAEIDSLQQRRYDRRRKKYRSRLADFRAEIVSFLKNEKGSYRLVAEWLATKKHFKVSHTTIMRFAKKLPELMEDNDAQLS